MKFSKIFETEADCINDPLEFIKDQEISKDQIDNVVFEGPLMQKRKGKEEFKKSKHWFTIKNTLCKANLCVFILSVQRLRILLIFNYTVLSFYNILYVLARTISKDLISLLPAYVSNYSNVLLPH